MCKLNKMVWYPYKKIMIRRILYPKYLMTFIPNLPLSLSIPFIEKEPNWICQQPIVVEIRLTCLLSALALALASSPLPTPVRPFTNASWKVRRRILAILTDWQTRRTGLLAMGSVVNQAADDRQYHNRAGDVHTYPG